MRKLLVLTQLLSILTLVGCGGGGGDESPTNKEQTSQPVPNTSTSSSDIKTLTVSPSLGKILNAKVLLKDMITNQYIGEQNTGSVGKVTFNIPATSRSVIVEVYGGNGAVYFDEATEQTVEMPSTLILKAATTVVEKNSEIGVTALTDAAVNYAHTLAKGDSILLHLNTAKATIESIFDVQDILQAPTSVGSANDLANLTSKSADQYALQLAALAKIAKQNLGLLEKTPAIKMALALQKDLADGNINGSSNDVKTLPYNLSTFVAQYSQQNELIVTDLLSNASQKGFNTANLQSLLAYVQNNRPILKVIPPKNPFALTGVTPTMVQIGDELTIKTNDLSLDKSKLRIFFANNVSAEIIRVFEDSLVVKVPVGAVSGKITLVNLDTNLTIESEMPIWINTINNVIAITGLSAIPAINGEQLTISGSGFGSDKTKILVTLANNIKAEVVSVTGNNQLVINVPQDAVTGDITITNTATNITFTSYISISKNECGASARLTYSDISQFTGRYTVEFKKALPMNSPMEYDKAEFNLYKNGQSVSMMIDRNYYTAKFICQNGTTKDKVFLVLNNDARVDLSLKNNTTVMSGVGLPNKGDTFTSEIEDVERACLGQVTAKVDEQNNSIKLSWPIGDAPIYIATVIKETQIGNSVFDPQTTWILSGPRDSHEPPNVHKGASYQFKVKITNFEHSTCAFPKIKVDFGMPLTVLPESLHNQISSLVGSPKVLAIVTAKVIDNKLTWNNAPNITSNISAISTDGTLVVGVDKSFFGKIINSQWVSLPDIKLTDLQGAIDYRAVQYLNNQWFVAGVYNTNQGVKKIFIANSADLTTWKINTFEYTENLKHLFILKEGSKINMTLIFDNLIQLYSSTDNGLSWIINRTINTTPNEIEQVLGYDSSYLTILDGVLYKSGYSEYGFYIRQTNNGIDPVASYTSLIPKECEKGLEKVTNINGVLYARCAGKLAASRDGRAWGVIQ